MVVNGNSCKTDGSNDHRTYWDTLLDKRPVCITCLWKFRRRRQNNRGLSGLLRWKRYSRSTGGGQITR
eukprot:92711-Prorocentrum_minimum.AAC.3